MRKTKQVKHCSWVFGSADTPIEDLQAKLNSVYEFQQKNDIWNVRLRFSHDEIDSGCDTEIVHIVEVWYEADMTEEDIKKEQEFLEILKAKRKAEDEVLFNRLKKKYGWS